MHGGPWLGMIISRKVGDAVTRHGVARRIRAGFREHRGELTVPETFVVVRAYPSIARRTGREIADALHDAFTHRKAVAALAAASADLRSLVAGPSGAGSPGAGQSGSGASGLGRVGS